MKADRPSNTARVIAAATILLASEQHAPDPVAPGAAGLCEKFLAEDAVSRLLAASARNPSTRWFWRWIERLTLPGIIHHYWHRKQWIEIRCRRAIQQGFRRILVVGAGFDTLGVRLAQESAEFEVIEVDHPATQAVKRSALVRGGLPLPANLRFTSIDLTTGGIPLPHPNGESTVFILEGVLMYLREQDVIRLLNRIREETAGQTLVIFSFMTRWPDGGSGFRPRSRMIETWLSWCKEPFTWSFEPERMEEFLLAHGFRLVEMALTREIWGDSWVEGGMLEGENLVVCEPT